jgi:hypothetical protein
MISIAVLTKGAGYAVVVDGQIHSTDEKAAEAIKERERLERSQTVTRATEHGASPRQ